MVIVVVDNIILLVDSWIKLVDLCMYVFYFFLSFSFGVAENAEAGMTVHSQS